MPGVAVFMAFPIQDIAGAAIAGVQRQITTYLPVPDGTALTPAADAKPALPHRFGLGSDTPMGSGLPKTAKP